MSLESDCLKAVAQAHAIVSRPISVDPQVEEVDRIAAQKFLAMYDAASRWMIAHAKHVRWDFPLTGKAF